MPFYFTGQLISPGDFTCPFPATTNGTPLKTATFSAFTLNSGAKVSQIFFLGLRTSSGVPGNPSKEMRSPGTQPLGGMRISTFSGVLAHITMPEKRKDNPHQSHFTNWPHHSINQKSINQKSINQSIEWRPCHLPSELIPRIFAGFKFVKTTTKRSFMSSIFTCLTNPLIMVRSLPSPRSIFST